VVATVAIALVYPYRLTDGDSCLYAAMSHDMAMGGSWVAPRWDFHGESFSLLGPGGVCFHDHPPGAFWLAAILERRGAPVERAALAANALWTLAAAGGVVAIARRFVARGAADFAGVVFLLHVGVMHYVQRAALELPLAATASWAIAAGLRLDRSRWWTFATAAALAGAVMVRGVFGLVPAGLLVLALLDPKLRPPWIRLAIALALAAGALWAFDRVHASQFGGMHQDRSHGFWSAYVERQVLPSLTSGGTSHSVDGATLPYYVGRVLLYTLPWSLLPLRRLVRGPRPVASPEAWRLGAAWIVVVVAGASMTSREGSRYLFQAWIASSVLAALALPREPRGNVAWVVSTLLLLAVPAQIVLKSAFHERDAWWQTAEIAAQHRYQSEHARGGALIRGPFQPEDDRMKSLLRFHLDAWISSKRVTEVKGLQWVPGAGEDFPVGRVVFATPLGALVDYGR
jgi:4-amino-4-deoxy-L-arabinose transferase-like glycosyltransferase